MIGRLLVTGLALAVLLTALPGCAAVRVRILPSQKEEDRQLRRSGNLWQRLVQPKAAAEEAAVALVEVAREAWPGVMRGDAESMLVYRAALRRLVLLQEAHDWTLPMGVEFVRRGPEVLDPAAPDLLVPADQIKIGGVPRRVLEEGVGLPCVAWFRPDSPFLDGEPGHFVKAGLAIPVTAVLSFDREGAGRWEFVRTLQRHTMVFAGQRRDLAADFSAPLALVISKGENRALDIQGLLRPIQPQQFCGLYQLQPFDPERIPVVFVHGLMSRPETWRQTVNELLADPQIRDHYQFWFYIYPTGLSVWESAARLRSELDRFNEALAPRLRDAADRRRLGSKILVGHSMGGLIAGLQVREGGAPLWAQFSETPLDELPISPRAAQTIRRLLDFTPRRDVSRVVFMATPHRGSPMALRPTATFFAARVRYGLPDVQLYRAALLAVTRENVRQELAQPANSIRFLREDAPKLLAILNLPRDHRVPVHSVLGDRGRGDAPEGGDGVVPFFSASFPGAVSEKIVPSGHGAHEHPEGIAELRRILREAL